MPILEAIAWAALTFTPLQVVGAGPMIDEVNDKFAQGVDAGKSCWDRVGGTVGEYGKPSNYSLDLICNWRLKKSKEMKEVNSWELVRD